MSREALTICTNSCRRWCVSFCRTPTKPQLCFFTFSLSPSHLLWGIPPPLPPLLPLIPARVLPTTPGGRPRRAILFIPIPALPLSLTSGPPGSVLTTPPGALTSGISVWAKVVGGASQTFRQIANKAGFDQIFRDRTAPRPVSRAAGPNAADTLRARSEFLLDCSRLNSQMYRLWKPTSHRRSGSQLRKSPTNFRRLPA